MTGLQHQALAARVDRAFRQTFGAAPQWLAQAPGRVNLIGEHTDYNNGFVLPCAIDFRTVVAARPRSDTRVRVLALDQREGADEFAVDQPISPRVEQGWTHYVRGMAQALKRRGHAPRGADLAVAGDVPQGAGLSSSASLAVAVGLAFKALWEIDPLGEVDLALAAQEAEHSFAGCQCGLMDPLSSVCGKQGHALLIDCQNLQAEPVPLPTGAAVMIVHSGIRRGLAQSEYNLRRAQCQAAARHWGVPTLRDVALSEWERGACGLDPVVHRRARHVLTENQRTLKAAQALARGDLAGLGPLMAQSHASLRDDFEVTLPPIDALVDTIQAVIGPTGGVRMTGGGFGGCVVAVLPLALVEQVRHALTRHYRGPSGAPAEAFVCQASAGAGLVPRQSDQ